MFCKSGAGDSISKESWSGLTESDDPTGDILDGRGPPLTQQDVENYGGNTNRVDQANIEASGGSNSPVASDQLDKPQQV